MIGIYKITSPTKRIYIGQSKNIEKRFKKYTSLDTATKTQTILWASLNKYGASNHTFELVEECLESDLNRRERYWQDFYNVLNGGLNCILTECEEKVRIISEETRKKYSDWQKDNKNPKGFKGKKHSPEVVESIRKMHTNKIVSIETREKQSKAKKGKKLTDEHKRNMKGKRYSINGCKVLNTKTNKIFLSIEEAAKSENLVTGTLSARLSGRLKNNTDFILLKN